MQQRGATQAQIREEMKEQEKDLLREKIDSLLLIQRGKDLDIKVDNEVSKRLAEVQAECQDRRSRQVPAVDQGEHSGGATRTSSRR